ncbi:MAG: D-cysteine desulfhydrase family protein [Rhodanobacter sp.]
MTPITDPSSANASPDHQAIAASDWKQRLARIARVELAQLPTPLSSMRRLAASLSVPPRLFVKRDDCTGLAFGGNKTRKLEFTIAAAMAAGADTLITTGGVQSNHVRQTAAAAAKWGLACHAILDNPLGTPPPDYLASGNRLLDTLLGARIHPAPSGEAAIAARVTELASEIKAAGGHPFVVPLGASDEIGSLGYVVCATELLAQIAEQGLDVSHVVLCTGSAGTHAGLLTGLRLEGSAIQVIGISSSEPAAVKAAKVADISARILRLLGQPPWHPLPDDIRVHDEYVGAGYGAWTVAAEQAIRLVASTEGMLLDPVYTGKAMAGLIDLLARGALKDVRDVVFLHTGGAPALFAYQESFQASAPSSSEETTACR